MSEQDNQPTADELAILNDEAIAALGGTSPNTPEVESKPDQTAEPEVAEATEEVTDEVIEDVEEAAEEDVDDSTETEEETSSEEETESEEEDQTDKVVEEALKKQKKQIRKQLLSQVSKKDKEIQALKSKLDEKLAEMDSNEVDVIDQIVETKIQEKEAVRIQKREETIFFKNRPEMTDMKEALTSIRDDFPNMSWEGARIQLLGQTNPAALSTPKAKNLDVS